MTDYPDAWLQFYYLLALVFRGSLVLVLTVSVVAFPREFIPVERWGMGIAAGGAFMTLPVLAEMPGTTSPFNGWSGTVFAAGILLAASARLYRGMKHWRNGHPSNPGWRR